MNTVAPGILSPQIAARPAGAARVGVGGPVGSGKTALLENLIPRFLRRGTDLADRKSVV